MIHLRQLLLWLALFLCSAILCGAELTILATTDFHGHIRNLQRFAPVIAAERARAGNDNFLLIDAGDTLQGTFEAAWRGGEIPVRLINHLGCDFWTPGNHDFEVIPFRFADIRAAVLGANWETADFKPQPWRLIRRAGHDIAVIGLTETNLPLRTLPDDGVRFTPQAEALRRIMPDVRRAKPDFIILVRHDGLYHRGGRLSELLAEFPEIDLVIGGHTHAEMPGERAGSAWYVQPGKHGNALAVIRVDFERNKALRIASELRHTGAGSPIPPEIEALMAEANAAGKRVIGILPEPLREPESPDFTGTPLGRLTGRAMLEATGAQVAIYNRNFGSRTFTGQLTARDLFTLFPFANRLCLVEFTPDELRAVLENEAALLKKGRRAAIFAGVSLRLNPRGEITRLQLPAPGANGRVKVALTDYYLAGSGGLTLPARDAPANGAPYQNTRIPIRDAIEAALPKHMNP